MKKIFSFGILVIGLLVLFGCTKQGGSSLSSGKEVIDSLGWQTYESKVGGFSLQFPNNRTFQENVYGSLVMFFTPTTPGDKLKENVGIVTEKLNNNMSLDEYYTLTKPQLEQTIPQFKELSNDTIQIHGMTAKKLIYQGSQANIILQWQQIYFIKDTTVYVITYTASKDTFNEFIDQVNSMINTFTLL